MKDFFDLLGRAMQTTGTTLRLCLLFGAAAMLVGAVVVGAILLVPFIRSA